MSIVRDGKNAIKIKNLSYYTVNDSKTAIAKYLQGEENRKYNSTEANPNSSRSHVILKLKLEIRNSRFPLKKIYSYFMLADLAGSESIGNSKTKGVAKREGS